MAIGGSLVSIALALGIGDILKDVEPAAGVEARAESRARPAGYTDPDALATGELEILGGASAGFRLRPFALALRYAPTITFTTYDPLSDPLILHQGMARAHLQVGSNYTISTAHLRQHGERSYTAALIHEEEDGRRLRLEFLPEVERLPITSHFTTLGLMWAQGRRNEWRVSGYYGSFGGRSEWARRRLPRQSGPRLVLEGDVGLSGRNAVLARARFARTELEPGPTFLIGELEGGWRHNRDRRTDLSGFIGVFGGYNEEPLGNELRSVVLPTLRGEMNRSFKRGRQAGDLELAVVARPWINQLEASLDPRITFEASFDWSWRDSVGGLVELGQAWVLDEKLALDGRVLVLGTSLVHPLTTFLDVEGGMRLFRQRVRYGIGWWGPAQWRWDLFAALSLRSDFFEPP